LTSIRAGDGRAAGASLSGALEFVKEKAGIREWRLKSNGLQVLLLQNRVAPVATFCVVYRVGSRHEAVGHTGATHLLEHLMFKGTPEFNREGGTQIAATLEAVGARFNATTWFDRTNYFETVPSDQIDLAVSIEASRMRGSFIRDGDRIPEMTVVRNEFERGENSPFQVLYKESFAAAFREHPYHHPTIGWKSDIEGVSTARLKEFYDTFYHPDNATAILIGDFEEDSALALLDRQFGKIPRSEKPIPRTYTEEPKQEGERRFIVRRSGQIGWVALSFRSVAAADPDAYPLAVLANVLGSGMTSRLYQALVEPSLAMSVNAISWQLRDPSLFSIFAALTPGTGHRKAEDILRAEIARVVREGIRENEIQKAKNQIEADVIFERDTTDQVAGSLTEAIAVAGWEWYVDYLDRIQRVTGEDVARAARACFHEDFATVGWFVPKDNGAAPGAS
jgi:zinc protease